MTKVIKTFSTAIRALRRNKMRAALTTLGIVIGVGAVIAMMEIGSGSSQAIQKSIASMGANNIMVFAGNATPRGVSSGSGGRRRTPKPSPPNAPTSGRWRRWSTRGPSSSTAARTGRPA
jgi:putative ABC transport system permease protein